MSTRDWGDWIDGQPRRLKRGRDYTGDPKDVIRAARAAAAEVGKLAVASRDSSGQYDYVWVQFVDGEVEAGRPCPVCGCTELEKIQKFFLRCKACGSRLKAADEWEVTAGRFASPEAPPEEVGTTDVAGARPRPEDFGQIRGARVLSVDGEEVDEVHASDDFVIEVSVSFLQPIHAAWPQLQLLATGTFAGIQDGSASPVSASVAGTRLLRARVPGGYLLPRIYEVQFTLVVHPGPDLGAKPFKLVNREVVRLKVLPDSPQDELPSGSPIDWELLRGPEEHHVRRDRDRPPRSR